MTVSVANRLVQGRGSLSELGALVLAFIDGGVEWLAWAGASPTVYAFADETMMVAAIQQGLHNSSLAWVPLVNLLVSPVKLMTFNLADLRILAKAAGGADDLATASRLGAILAAHNLLRQADLAAVPVFLTDLGLGTEPFLQGLGLNGMIGLHDLLARSQPDQGGPELQRDAAAFALQQARTPEEFGDYYRAYMALTVKLQTLDQSSDRRATDANAAVATLLPVMFGALDCPQMGGLAAPAEVAATVSAWLRQGRRLGFSRLSEGVCRIVESTTFTNETGAAAQQVVDLYLANAQSFLAANEPRTGMISQDGQSCVLPAQSGNLYAELLLGPSGAVTLQRFRRIQPPLETT